MSYKQFWAKPNCVIILLTIGSDRVKKKGVQLDWKLGKRGSIGLNINTMRCQSDRAWLFEGFEDVEKGTQSDRKSKKLGSSPRNLPNMPKYGSSPPPPPGLLQGFQSADSIHAINLLTSLLFTINTMWTN